MVRRLKRGECRPSAERLPALLAIGARRALEKLSAGGYPPPGEDIDAIGLYAGVLGRWRIAIHAVGFGR